jgi:hypothetical protein
MKICIAWSAMGLNKRPWIHRIKEWPFACYPVVDVWGVYTGDDVEDGELEIHAEVGDILYYGQDRTDEKIRQYVRVGEEGVLVDLTRRKVREHFLNRTEPAKRKGRR